MVSYDSFTAEVPKIILEHEEFLNWVDDCDGKELIKIAAAIEKIKNEGIITSAKSLENGLYEKKWNSGLRLYFSIIIENDGKKTLLLIGSNKGLDQKRAIRKARLIAADFNIFYGNISINKGAI